MNKAESVLRMEHIIFDEIKFSRRGFKNDCSEATFRVGSFVQKVDADPDSAIVHLKLDVCKRKEYTVRICASGYFSISENNPNRDVLLKENAVAIMFPYVRAQLSLITAQPETDNLILPVMNISAMLKEK